MAVSLTLTSARARSASRSVQKRARPTHRDAVAHHDGLGLCDGAAERRREAHAQRDVDAVRRDEGLRERRGVGERPRGAHEGAIEVGPVGGLTEPVEARERLDVELHLVRERLKLRLRGPRARRREQPLPKRRDLRRRGIARDHPRVGLDRRERVDHRHEAVVAKLHAAPLKELFEEGRRDRRGALPVLDLAREEHLHARVPARVLGVVFVEEAAAHPLPHEEAIADASLQRVARREMLRARHQGDLVRGDGVAVDARDDGATIGRGAVDLARRARGERSAERERDARGEACHSAVSGRTSSTPACVRNHPTKPASMAET